ncbi:hypothetical protein LX77_03864 [Gelidibacter algens]|uniref:Uncharacterized protein n=1 Tax=Gelidibacter algens TaxID=49280 RepID=A0A327RN40_9FLAO|nr:hypothetical protein LX77_03864 [Gelidibacter algens]
MSVESNLLEAKQILNLSDDEFNGVKLAIKYMCEKQGVNYNSLVSENLH